MSKYLRGCGVEIFTGSPNEIFGGLLGWTVSGSGFIESKKNLPKSSVGFWISDQDLTLNVDVKHYNYPSNNQFVSPKRFKYVGFVNKVDVIPKGTLLRMSLARWWKPEEVEINKRCYLQLSGWY